MSQGSGWAIVALLAVASCSEQKDARVAGCQRNMAFQTNSEAIGAAICSPIAVWQGGKRLLNYMGSKLRSAAPHS